MSTAGSGSEAGVDAGVEGRVAIVTGAGGGLGRSHALLLAAHGAKVVVNDLGASLDGSGQGDAADKVVEEIRAAGGEAIANKDSVSDRDSAGRIVEDAVKQWGTVHIVVNNAGILRDRTFKKMTLDDWDSVIGVHLNGTAYVTWHAWKLMYEQNYGRVVFTSSTSGIFGSFGQSNYGAAKMGMVGMMNNLAREGASHNVKTNCLAPGAATRMTASVPGSKADPDDPAPERHPGLVSPAVLWLCSEEAPNGRIIHAAGGRFSSSAIFVNEGVNLGVDASYETLAPQVDTVLDLSNAKQRQQRPRRQRQQTR